jgi:chromate transporter
MAMNAPPIPDPEPVPPAAAPPAPSPPEAQPPATPQPTLTELFLAFLGISLAGFGGVLAWARRSMVEERRWLTAEQFNEIYAFCAFLPGGNVINFSVVFGSRFHGAPGALAALVGLLGPPILLVLVVAALIAHYGDLPLLRRALVGVAAAAAGLMLATVAKMAGPLFRKRSIAAPLIALATFVTIGLLQWPLPLVLPVIVTISVIWAWRQP